jgi:CHAD domain-containing protein
MGYFFEQGETVASGMRRIACAELAEAAQELSATGPGEDERVHSVRKRTKKLRALLRLARGSLGARAYRTENFAYREAARGLSGARRAAAMQKTLDQLLAAYADQISPAAFSAIRGSLEQHRQQQLAAQHAGETRALAAVLIRESQERAPSWELEPAGFDLLSRGIARSYARARKAFARAYERQTNEAFHEWRKRSKDHWYHLRLLEPCWPGPLGALEKELHRLTELLGDEHDLVDLHEYLVEGPLAMQAENVGALLVLCERRRAELRREARWLGERVFAERPKLLVERLRVWFEAWQAENAEQQPASASEGEACAIDEVDDTSHDGGVTQNAHVPEASRLD